MFLVDLAELGEVTCEEKEDRGEKKEGNYLRRGLTRARHGYRKASRFCGDKDAVCRQQGQVNEVTGDMAIAFTMPSSRGSVPAGR